MVAEPWIDRLRSSVVAAATKKMKESSKWLQDGADGATATATVGILSFEVANAMSRAINLYRSLKESEIARLRSQVLASHAVHHLVSSDEQYLLSLALAEKIDDLNHVAAVATRLGRRCSHPALIGFEHVYSDLLAARIDPSDLGFLSKDMDGTIRKMERFVATTASLYAELEVLTELEQTAKKYVQNPVNDETGRAFNQKIQWQRQDAKHLRDSSLWNQNYDKVALLLARAICTIHSRICLVFGESILGLDCLVSDQSPQFSGQVIGRRHYPIHSGSLDGKSGQIPKVALGGVTISNSHRDDFPKSGSLDCSMNPGRFFVECFSLGKFAMLKDANAIVENESYISRPETGGLVEFSGEHLQNRSGKLGGSAVLGSNRLTSLASSSTIGGSALALHYANIIIIIEKLLNYPLLIGEEARDDLYQMLPSSLRAALRKRLKSVMKNLAIYDAPLAHDWKETLDQILSWLSPMAHDMIRWQTERNFELQQIILKSDVLLLQTIYFADREKTEAVICELLVGLNYICRYEQQQNALLDCGSSLDFEDSSRWQYCS